MGYVFLFLWAMIMIPGSTVPVNDQTWSGHAHSFPNSQPLIRPAILPKGAAILSAQLPTAFM